MSRPTGILKYALIVDDNAMVRLACRRALEAAGWLVDEAGCGNQALAKLLPLGSRTYDFILVDVKMSPMDGMELYLFLRSNAPALSERVVLMSGSFHEPRIDSFLSIAHLPTLRKPFRSGELIRASESVGGGV
jgi:CheY-like chemotaxis protein